MSDWRRTLSSGYLWVWYALAVVVVALDQVTKLWAESALQSGPVVVIPGYFQFQLAYNTGAAFSFLGDAGGWQRWLFAVIAIGVSAALMVWMARVVKSRLPGRQWELLALSLILGGALGNLYDRLALGHVVDFIVWHYHQYYWPTFNIADSAICIGAALLIVDMVFFQGRPDQQDENP